MQITGLLHDLRVTSDQTSTWNKSTFEDGHARRSELIKDLHEAPTMLEILHKPLLEIMITAKKSQLQCQPRSALPGCQ